MKRIDKNTYRAEFDIYTTKYLQESQTVQGGFYPKLSSVNCYINFSHKKYRLKKIVPSMYDGWLSVLMHEQEQDEKCRCCYCMRELQGNDISVEHLIPERLEDLNMDEEYKFYCEKAPVLRKNVILGSVLDKISRRVEIDVSKLNRKPHFIAHSNLFPACKKEFGCSCNNDRGNNRILPLMLMDDVEKNIIYKPDGKIQILYSDIQSVSDTYSNLNINCNTLTQIRHLWYLFSRKGVKPDSQNSSTEAEMQSFIEKAFNGKVDPAYEYFYQNEYYRNLVPKYNWFYTYYINKYPIQ